MKEMKYPDHFSKDGPNPSNYLIQQVDDYNCLIHRELDDAEIRFFPKEDIFEFNEKSYLSVIGICRSEEDAVAAVNSYWGALEFFSEHASHNDKKEAH